MKKYKLAIVQTHPTQFDGPLFRLLAAHPAINLMVYYTSRDARTLSYDPELGRKSGWDHDITTGYEVSIFPDKMFKRLALAKNIVEPGRYDLVIVSGYNSWLTLTIAVLGKFHRTAVGLRCDSVFTNRQSTWKWVLKDALLPQLFRLYETGHPTGSLTRTLLRHYGVPDVALFYFPYAVDNVYLERQAAKGARNRYVKRRAMGIHGEDFVVLGILKFVPREDPLTLLLAYSVLVQRYPHTHLILVGDGSLMADIVKQIEELGLTQVHLPGYLPYSELASYYTVSDVFVHPAQVEPWGVSVNEAMVCGLPVIVADTVGSGADLVEEGKTGLVYKAGQSDLLAEQLLKLISDPTFVQEMGRNAIARVAEWSYTTTVKQTLKALDYVTAQSSRAGRS